MKKNLLIVLVTVLAMAFGIMFVGCKKPTAQTNPFKTTKDIYAFSAFTGTALLGQFETAKVVSGGNSFSYSQMSKETSATIPNEKLDEINKYLNMFEGMLADGNPIETAIEKNVEFNGVQYSEKMTIKVKNMDGTTTEKVLYYNETAINADEALQQSDGEDDDDDEFKEIETELSGVMVVGEDVFEAFGKKELEGEEMEIEFITIDKNGNKVVIEQEIEKDEQEYLYEIIDSTGKVISSSSMEFEVEKDEISIELEVKNSSGKEVYKFEKKIEEGKTIIKMHYTIDGKMHVAKIKATVDEATGEKHYEYNFSNGHKVEKERCQN